MSSPAVWNWELRCVGWKGAGGSESCSLDVGTVSGTRAQKFRLPFGKVCCESKSFAGGSEVVHPRVRNPRHFMHYAYLFPHDEYDVIIE